jgi:SAM-dependent methyltransferase
MTQTIQAPAVDLDSLRRAIQAEYAVVAREPEHGFHFLVGRPLAQSLGYAEAWLDGIPEPTIASFAGTGNPFSVGGLQPGERVVDVGSGGGFDSLIAAGLVGANGRVMGVDMTPAMLEKARASAAAAGMNYVEFREGFAESLPIDDGWADVVISNGVLNLMPDKDGAVARNGACAQARRTLADRRYPRPEAGSPGREGGHRPLDWLNCWCSPGGRDSARRHGGGVCRFRNCVAH